VEVFGAGVPRRCKLSDDSRLFCLLIEWPEGEHAATKYWLSALAKNISFRDRVDAAKLRWRIDDRPLRR